MKKQLLKKLFAFITIMVFSISILHAQIKCTGNKVIVCHISRSTGQFVCKCVSKNHAAGYVSQGWTVSCNCTSDKNDNKLPVKHSGEVYAANNKKNR